MISGSGNDRRSVGEMGLEAHLELLKYLNLLDPDRTRKLSDAECLDVAIAALLN